MHEPMPHGHITHKLRRSLVAVIGLCIVAVGLLATTVLLINYNIEQTAIRSKQAAIDNVSVLLEAQQEFSLPVNTSYSPALLDEDTLVTVIAKNQPAVVRIVAMYCADITLTAARKTSEFPDTCSGRVSSGSFISSDGYIAASGHGTTISAKQALIESLTTAEKVDQYLDYLVGARLMSVAQSSLIKASMASGSSDGQATFDATIDLIPDSSVVTDDVSMRYAVQLSNKPVRIEQLDGRLEMKYSDVVVNAQLVDKDYDPAGSAAALTTGEFTSSDVALLKASGAFPYIKLGSIDTIQPGSRLTAIGFPSAIAGIDSQVIQSIPSITQGTVKAINSDAQVNGRKIIATTVPIGQGHSGGPALDDSGMQVGLNTYSVLECPELDCYGDGQVRDIADIKALLAKNNITLQQGGVSDIWEDGLNAYTRGDYEQALDYFTKVKADYPANYLVSSFLAVASSEVGTVTDASTSYQARTAITYALIILSMISLVIVISLVILIIHFTAKHRRQTRSVV